ncbi:MAG: DNA translocase FtsK [Candidatus Pacebacteria bacterium]|nr:DNA translocase FtsK [Candidatus Paceibacterota bacterium]MDD4998887.1 DNA translocase FtsK [Candidatus Paceibacterota bacterium]
MRKRKKKIENEEVLEEGEEKENVLTKKINPEIKNSILAIFFFAFALVLVLSYFNLSGPIGRILFRIFDYLLGLGYFILPFLFLVLSYNFFRLATKKINFKVVNLQGAFLVLLSALSLLEMFAQNKGGFLGGIGAFITNYLGFWATLIIYLAFLISGLLLVFNTPLKIPKRKQSTGLGVSFPEESPSEENSKKESFADSRIFNTKKNGENKEINTKDEEERKSFFGTKSPAFISRTQVNYKFPPLDLLETDNSRPTVGDIKANANIIKRTLQSFGIEVEMGEVNIGPTVTQYTLKPAEGIKLSSITALHSDLALALAAHPLRIEAPIPGKSLVGIEVPNKSISLVRLGNLLKETDFQKNTPPLVFALGRDVKGEIVLADLSKMPHLLIAGATGTGKSVCIHSILSSFLIKNSPAILKLILVDPKRVELSRYNGISHLLTPVITDNKKVLPVLRWALNEMDRRYDLLSQYQSRDIDTYNSKAISRKEQSLPYIVIIIDELADLMMQYGRDLEALIIRIAQMARATGIHLIISTQRPSVEVITGLIKANITARIAFQVASQVDSRTILDTGGAEKLLGHGDMLYLSPQTSKPKRIQGVFISEKEIDRITDFLLKESLSEANNKDEDKGSLAEDLESCIEENNDFQKKSINFEDWDEKMEDELYPEAYQTVVKAGKASASLLQRKLSIGYVRAARLLDILEAKGVIGPVDGAKPRIVFVKDKNQEEEEKAEI